MIEKLFLGRLLKQMNNDYERCRLTFYTCQYTFSNFDETVKIDPFIQQKRLRVAVKMADNFYTKWFNKLYNYSIFFDSVDKKLNDCRKSLRRLEANFLYDIKLSLKHEPLNS